MSCPLITLESGETVQFIPKPMQSDLDWLISNLPTDLPIPDTERRYYCTEPGGVVLATQTLVFMEALARRRTPGFTCLCLDRYRGERCEKNVTIHSLKLLGERINEGTLAITSRSSPNTYVLIHQERWNMNLSQLACQYLGFEGVYATLSGPLYNSSSVDTPAQAESVICPANATNITDCWYSETKVGRTTERECVSIVCCPVNPCNISGQPLGLESGALPDSAFSESSCISASFCSRFGRLNSETAWIANPSDQYQWMQVQFESSYIVTAITTQGGKLFGKWVTSYTLSSSFDNVAWTDYLNVYTGSIEIIPGNYDRDSHVTHTLARPVVGRFFRIHPKTNEGDISLRMELYGYGPLTDAIASLNFEAKFGCNPPVLGEGLGVEDGRIPDSSLTSSSIWSSGHEAYRGRLNAVVVSGNAGAWVAAAAANNEWIKVDLGEDTLVTGVITQGRPISDQWATSFRISYSRDNINWTFALEKHCGVQKTYAGNFDADTHVTILFPEPVAARYVTLHLVTFARRAAVRFEVLGINT
eukprot:XP_011665357.1 PREDICTED: lactadherin-like [Strongylocentrotus purpuratus]